MDKNQIFITSGTEYKRMTKELLEKADLQSHIGDRKKKDRNQAESGFSFRGFLGCNDSSGSGCRNYRVSEGAWLPGYGDVGGILGRR